MKKKILIATLIFLIVIANLFFYFLHRSYGFYEPITNSIYCTNRANCIHEIGHKVDDEANWISDTFEWKYAIDWYRVKVYYYPEERDPMSNKIMFFPGIGWSEKKISNPIIASYWTGGWGGLRELYAYILEKADGKRENMPEMFREFYNWERIAELMADYNLE